MREKDTRLVPVTASLSSRGGRKENQDCCGFRVETDFACWVVADGLGGHRGGETASRLAVETILKTFSQTRKLAPETLAMMLFAANSALVQEQECDEELSSMRTTAVILLSDFRNALCGHIGDSRLYHFSNGQIVLQTRDHSIPQLMADTGDISPDQIRYHEDRNRLLQALGNAAPPKPTLTPSLLAVKPGDVFLLCTDGFWEYVLETEMTADLKTADGPEAWLDRMEKRLLNRVVKKHDNYTALAVYFK